MSSRLSLMVASVALAFAASTAFAAPQDAASSAPAKNSQQQRMTDCNKQATGKTGDERKAFMSSCLKGESAAPAKMTQQEKMMLLHERQVMLLLPASVTSTGAPQLGQRERNPFVIFRSACSAPS